jgi:hypothetical protein
MEQTIAWSETTSALIASGEDQSSGAQFEEEPPPALAPQPAPRGNGRRQAVEDLL